MKNVFDIPKEQCDIFAFLFSHRTLLYLAFAILDRMKPFDAAAAVELLKAAQTIRDVTGGLESDETAIVRDWNASNGIRTPVVVSLSDRAPFIALTVSPAFDSPKGPHIILDDFEHAVELSAVTPYRGSRKGVIS